MNGTCSRKFIMGYGLQVCVVSCILLQLAGCGSFFENRHKIGLQKSRNTTLHMTTQKFSVKWKQWGQWTFETNPLSCAEWNNARALHWWKINVSWANSFDHLWGIWYAAAPLRYFGRTRSGFATKFDGSATRVCDGLSLENLWKPTVKSLNKYPKYSIVIDENSGVSCHLCSFGKRNCHIRTQD